MYCHDQSLYIVELTSQSLPCAALLWRISYGRAVAVYKLMYRAEYNYILCVLPVYVYTCVFFLHVLLFTTNHHLLAIPRYRHKSYGCRAFSVAGPMAWNSLPDFIWDLTSSADCFKRQEARDDRVLWWQWHQLDHRPYANNLHLSRPITTPTRHHSIFTGRMLFLTSIQQCQSSEGSYVSIISLQKLE